MEGGDKLIKVYGNTIVVVLNKEAILFLQLLRF